MQAVQEEATVEVAAVSAHDLAAAQARLLGQGVDLQKLRLQIQDDPALLEEVTGDLFGGLVSEGKPE